MKKYFLLLICLLFTSNVYAENYYDKVYVTARFTDDINIEEISIIDVFIDDYLYLDHNAELTRDNNYSVTLYDVPYGDLKVSFGLVRGDYLGKYNIVADIVNITDLIVQVNVTVEYQDNTIQSEKEENETTRKATTTNSITTKKQDNQTDDNENKNKNYTIVKIVYIIFGIIFLLILFYMLIRIIRANK